MKYNIALLHYSCPPVVGGVEEIVRQQASVFARNYHNVKVLTGVGERFSESCELEINPLLGSQNRQVLNAQKSALKDKPEKLAGLIKKLYKYLTLSLKDFDLLIAHNVLTMPFNLPLTGALHRLGQEGVIPIISWNHDSPYFYADTPEYLDAFPWNILKRAYAGIHYVVISENRKKMFADLYGIGKHLDVIPNGIDPIAFFRLDPSSVHLIQEQRLFEAELLMVQPTRLHPRKNVELSIRVTKAIRDMGIGVKMLITGAYDPHTPKTVDYLNKLKALIRDLDVENDVLIMAEHRFKSGEKLSVDRIIIRDLYLITDILFLPSLQEGFGIPLLEAGMIKLPVACSNIPPFVEIGGQDVCIFDLYDPPEQIARKIMAFIDGIKPHRMFRKVLRNYVWDNIYQDKILPLLTRVAKDHH